MPILPAARTARTLRSRPVAARRLAILLPLLLLSAPSHLAAQEPTATAPDRVESVELRPTDAGAVEIRLASSAELGLVGVRADPRGGLFLQLPQHVLGPAVEDLLPPDGVVSAVRCTVERTARGPLARIAVTTRRPVTHALTTEGRRLALRLWPADEEPDEVKLRRLAAELRASLATSERAREELSGRLEVLAAENRELVASFETLEARRSDLDETLKATLGEVTEMLRGLSARSDELNRELRLAAEREDGLQRQVARLESELAASASAGEEGRETREQLARLEEERDSLRREIDAREARVVELEGLLAAQQAELVRLEGESLALATRMNERLAAATVRENDLRSQLAGLAAALTEARELEPPPSVELEPRVGDNLPVRAPTIIAEGTPGGPGSGPASGRTTHGVRLRSGPGTEFETLRGLAPDTVAEVLSRGPTWLRVRLTNGEEGWVHGDYFELDGGEGALPPAAAAPPAAGPDVPGDLFYIVVATESAEPVAAAIASGLRAKGYASEVHWSASGYYVVTLDRLPVDPARQKRDQAVAAGDVPADSYLVAGSTFRQPSS